MSLRDEIAVQLREVVGTSTGFGETWTARARSSAPGIDPPTYGAAANLEGHQSGFIETSAQDEDGVWYKVQRCRFRTSDAATRYKYGDQMRLPNSGNYWSVEGVSSAGIGTIAYDLMRKVAQVADANRPGGSA